MPPIVILAGPPCSGKGTQASLLAASTSMIHLSTGDIFREHVARGTELGNQLKPYLDSGSFVPDDLTTDFVVDRLMQADVRAQGAILDGFPRTASQALAIKSRFPIAAVILLKANDKTLSKRAASRRIDSATGKIYNLEYNRPPADVDASRLVTRAMDGDPTAFKTRLSVYHGQAARVAPYFSEVTIEVNALQSIADANASIVNALALLQPAPAAGAAPTANNASSNTCTICLDQPGNYLCLPCGHQCGCADFLNQVRATSNKCPICRQSLTGIQRVFAQHVDDTPTTPTPPAPPTAQTGMLPSAPAPRLDNDATADETWSDDEDDAAATSSGAIVIDSIPLPSADATSQNVVVRVSVPDLPLPINTRPPVDVCCVIDTSGSMGASAAVAEDASTPVVNDGLNILDIVMHAVKTVIHSLGSEDRFSLVHFCESANVVYKMNGMDTAGKAAAVAALDELSPAGCTNLWDGLLKGMEELNSQEGAARKKTLFLLTDGVPNIKPPRGHIEELRNYRDGCAGSSNIQINTFGFGYSLDSKLLIDLAVEGQGTFGFIPDALIVGTNFVNSVANALTCFDPAATLSLVPCNGARLAEDVLDGGLVERNESWGRHITLGPLHYGQPRDISVPLVLPPDYVEGTCYLECVVNAEFTGNSASAKTTSRFSLATEAEQAAAVLTAARARVVTVGLKSLELGESNNGVEATTIVKSVLESIPDGEVFNALKGDVGGRMTKALQGKARFNRWGKHYLRALMRSHQLQLCTNFMDVGLQAYGSDAFRSFRQTGDEVFLGLPAPTPKERRATSTSRYSSSSYTPASTYRPSAPSPDMNSYYAGGGGGCFGGDNLVISGGGVAKKIVSIKAGDVVSVAGGRTATVLHVVKIKREKNKPLIELPGGLMITGGHPVKIDGAWRLPREVAEGKRVQQMPQDDGASSHVYTLVVEGGESVLVNGYECATWGHGMTAGGVEHAFFGSMSKIQDSLSKLKNDGRGMLEVTGLVRSGEGRVVAFA
jgi:adenylate kinase